MNSKQLGCYVTLGYHWGACCVWKPDLYPDTHPDAPKYGLCSYKNSQNDNVTCKASSDFSKTIQCGVMKPPSAQYF